MWWVTSALAGLLALQQVCADSSKPRIEATKFDSLPTNLFYFEDSDVVIVTDRTAGIAYRSDDAGFKWEALKGVKAGDVLQVVKHPYNNQVAVVLGFDETHWITKDQGKSWKEWTLRDKPTMFPISFHATDPDRMLVMTAECRGFNCGQNAYYTKDGFDSEPKSLLSGGISSCLWAKSTDLFGVDSGKKLDDQIFCTVQDSFNPFSPTYRLVTSNDFFESQAEPAMNEGRTVPGIISLAAVKHYLVAAAKSQHTSELAMYVTTDAATWHRAEFGEHRLEEDAYTLLESTNYSMQVDVLTTGPNEAMGVLLTSNSNGTFFTKNLEHTNRSPKGFVDFEKIQNIQGILMANVVDNWEDVLSGYAAKEVKSKISFDDGRTWQSLKVGEEELHLHSVTEQLNAGRVFSSPAPGIVMGIGNTGKYLHDWNDGDLYISDDAGLTWAHSLSKPQLYEFGDQGAIIVSIEFGETNKMAYSLNHGKDWENFEFEDDVRPVSLTTVPDSTSLKFILTATKGRGNDVGFYTYALDFSDLHEKKCSSNDFEDWYARVDKDGKATCIMGHKQKFRRRKADSKCFVDQEFKDPVPETEDCKCQDDDFECDYENGFTRVDGKCALTGKLQPPEGECKDGNKKFMGSSGYRLIPGNTCVKEGGVEKDNPVERDCDAVSAPVASGKIDTTISGFDGDYFLEYYYLERESTSSGHDETVIMRNDRRQVFVSYDHGKIWTRILKDQEVVAIYPHQYFHDIVYFITPSTKVHYSKDRGQTYHEFDAPTMPNTDNIQVMSFHPKEKDWLIWVGGRDCTQAGCQTIAEVTRKGGVDWEALLKSVRKCQFVYREDRNNSDQMVYCEQHQDENMAKPINLVSSTDWFTHQTEIKRDIINFATMAEYIVVALRDPEQETLQVHASIDGLKFADAKFPPNFEVPHQQAYTVLDSSTHAVFLHVTVNNKQDQEYGSIVKSNSNGTSYVLSAGEVNRNTLGYVDFEKMQGLEGVAIINRVGNVEEVNDGAAKKLKTYITHNDGADWDLIKRPVDPPNGGEDLIGCTGPEDKCSLHLHGYTERRDPRDSYSSPSAVGLMIAMGNVGEFLGYKKDANTFITRNGGITWTMAAPGNWQWEYGDQGSIIVMVKENEPTTSVLYSLDEGVDWYPYEFSTSEMEVIDITTVPSDTSRNFLLWGRIHGELVTVNLDFSGLKERSEQCKLDEKNPEADDYKLWTPRHPLSENDCLFGHVAQYHRKRTDRDCYNGGIDSIQHLHEVLNNCSCTRRDFECDYNYERQKDGSCKLVDGLQPPDPKAICYSDPDAIEYHDITGYRRIPLSTCSGGSKELDLTPRVYPCPGKETEYRKKHSLSGVAIFFIVVLSVGAAGGIGYWVWRNWNGDFQFGRIQLGNDGPVSIGGGRGHGAFDRDAPWIKYPIMALSGIVAVAATLPMVVGSIWKAVSTRMGRRRSGYSQPYTSRNSFARGRGDYAVVNPEDDELLGDDDSDEDV